MLQSCEPAAGLSSRFLKPVKTGADAYCHLAVDVAACHTLMLSIRASMGLTWEHSCMKQLLIMHQCAQGKFNAADAFSTAASSVPCAMFIGHDAWPWIMRDHDVQLNRGVLHTCRSQCHLVLSEVTVLRRCQQSPEAAWPR